MWGRYAYVNATVKCSVCGETETEPYAFQWGRCIERGQGHPDPYEVGDRIQWFSCGGRVPAFASIGEGQANWGDPRVRDLRLGAGDFLEWGVVPRCSSCGAEYGGLAIDVEGGLIASVRRLGLMELGISRHNWTLDRRAGWVARIDWAPGWSTGRADFRLTIGDCANAEIVTDCPDDLVERRIGPVDRRMIREDGPTAIPRYAFLDHTFACPHCRGTLTTPAAFWWGYCRDLSWSPGDASPATYRLGDQIRWRTSGGVAPAWARFVDGLGINAGDPADQHVIVMGGEPLQHGTMPSCHQCGRQYGGVAIEILDGRVVGGRLFATGEFDPGTFDHYVVRADGTAVGRSDVTDRQFLEVTGDPEPAPGPRRPLLAIEQVLGRPEEQDARFFPIHDDLDSLVRDFRSGDLALGRLRALPEAEICRLVSRLRWTAPPEHLEELQPLDPTWTEYMHASARSSRYADALVAVGDGVVPFVLAMVEKHGLQWDAVRVLAALPDRRALQYFIDAVATPGSPAREAAAERLGDFAEPSVIPLLRDTLDDGEPGIAAAAAWSLAKLGDGPSGESIAALAEDVGRDWEDRTAFVRALGRLADASAEAALLRLLDDSLVGWVAAECLGTMKATAAAPRLIRILDDAAGDDPAFRSSNSLLVDAALGALASIRDPTARPVLGRYLKSPLRVQRAAEKFPTYGELAAKALRALDAHHRNQSPGPKTEPRAEGGK
jgi:hypothetical protein